MQLAPFCRSLCIWCVGFFIGICSANVDAIDVGTLKSIDLNGQINKQITFPRLLGRSQDLQFNVKLSDADWRWLGEKRELIIGVAASDYPPV